MASRALLESPNPEGSSFSAPRFCLLFTHRRFFFFFFLPFFSKMLLLLDRWRQIKHPVAYSAHSKSLHVPEYKNRNRNRNIKGKARVWERSRDVIILRAFSKIELSANGCRSTVMWITVVTAKVKGLKMKNSARLIITPADGINFERGIKHIQEQIVCDANRQLGSARWWSVRWENKTSNQK